MNWRVKIHYTGVTRAQTSGRISSERSSSGQQHHPTMSGLNVSPVHGRHCICHRCERYAGRDAA